MSERKKGWVDTNKRSKEYTEYITLAWDRTKHGLPTHKEDRYQELKKRFEKKNVKY